MIWFPRLYGLHNIKEVGGVKTVSLTLRAT